MCKLGKEIEISNEKSLKWIIHMYKYMEFYFFVATNIYIYIYIKLYIFL